MVRPALRIASMSTTCCRSRTYGSDEIFLVRRRCSERALERNPLHAVEPGAQQLVGTALDPAGDVGVGGAAVGRVVLEAAVFRRIV